jgi:branched-chain amino acid transport system substrate-binding protein
LANNVESDELIKTGGKATEGLIIVLPLFDPEKQDSVVVCFVKKYKNRYNKTPDLYAANGYDAVYLIKVAIEKGGYNGEMIKDELYKINNYHGANGTISFDKNGDVIMPLAFKEMQNGKFAVIK